jgi:hypothetical protein
MMARPRTAKYPGLQTRRTVPEQATPQEPSSADASTSANPPQAGISKAEAVRQALAAGLSSPGDIAAFLKQKYGIDMARPMISAYKAQAKHRLAAKSSPPTKPRSADGTAHARPTVNADLITDIKAVKHLVERLGAAQVRRIIDLFD